MNWSYFGQFLDLLDAYDCCQSERFLFFVVLQSNCSKKFGASAGYATETKLLKTNTMVCFICLLLITKNCIIRKRALSTLHNEIAFSYKPTESQHCSASIISLFSITSYTVIKVSIVEIIVICIL